MGYVAQVIWHFGRFFFFHLFPFLCPLLHGHPYSLSPLVSGTGQCNKDPLINVAEELGPCRCGFPGGREGQPGLLPGTSSG